MSGINMLNAEFEGVKEMFHTNTIRVPEPICFGTTEYGGYIILEKLNFGGYSEGALYGQKLAAMHKCLSPSNKFGWRINNTIGTIIILLLIITLLNLILINRKVQLYNRILNVRNGQVILYYY